MKVGLFATGFAVGVGVLAYATLSRQSKTETQPLAKLAPIKMPHQVELEKYLDQMRSYLVTPPRDGVFGSDRIPYLHDSVASGIPAFKAITNLKGQIQMRSAVVGFQPVKYSQVKDENGKPLAEEDQIPENLDKVRVTPVHLLTPNMSLTHNQPNTLYDDGNDAKSNAWSVGLDQMNRFAAKLRDGSKETFSEQVLFNGQPSWIIAKAVYASVDSCYKCHMDIEKGKPIGYVVALISDAKN